MYKVALSEKAIEDIEKLGSTSKKRIVEKLKFFAESPLKYAKRVNFTQVGSYRFRIGDYRVIFDFDGETIMVLRVRHRSECINKFGYVSY